MPDPPNAQLDGGTIGELCARAIAEAPLGVGRLSCGATRAHGAHTERALGVRMADLGQQAPPHRAPRGLQWVVAKWVDVAPEQFMRPLDKQACVPLSGPMETVRAAVLAGVVMALESHQPTALLLSAAGVVSAIATAKSDCQELWVMS